MKLNAITVRHIMTQDVETLDPQDDVDLAEMFMRLDNLHHFPVVENGSLVGILSHRDVAHHSVSPSSSGMSVEARRQLNLRVKVQDIMTRNVCTISPDARVLEAAEVMKSRYLGCLPVVDEGDLVGIITGTDLLGLFIRAIREEQNPMS